MKESTDGWTKRPLSLPHLHHPHHTTPTPTLIPVPLLKACGADLANYLPH